MTNKEKDDKLLKNNSKEWWSNHSQDYVSPGEIPHLGVPDDMSDSDFIDYINKIDNNFRKDAYFAQDKSNSIFSKLIPCSDLSGKKVLEIGCGLGAHTEILSRSGAVLTSIDLSETSIKITKRRLNLKKLSAEVILADAEDLPFQSEYFDYIWTWGVIHHSPNTKKCSQELERVLKVNGKVGIMLYNKNSLYNWINVILRYGILQGKLFNHSIQELHNMYTDGKEDKGSPLAKYYTSKEIEKNLLPNIKFYKTHAFEQKHAFSFFVPRKYRRSWENLIPNSLYTFIWSKYGFLLFKEGIKK